jgi:Domain of unknown function (DUF4349)
MVAAIAALYIGALRPPEESGGIADHKGAGLAVEPVERAAFWQQTRLWPRLAESRAPVNSDQMVREREARAQPSETADVLLAVEQTGAPQDAAQKMIRTSSLELIVQNPADAAERIRALAERAGGTLVSSEVSGDSDTGKASVSISVPVAQFEAVRREIRQLGRRVEEEKIESQDVTRQYVDRGANLGNLRAEEAQYLTILKQAKTVKDTLDVSEKLGDVRGRIEQQQAEFNTLSKQVETVAISVTLSSEAQARVFGLKWRPVYRMKLDLRDGLDGLASYASALMAFVFLLPAIALWFATLVALAAAGWKLLRWTIQRCCGRQSVGVNPAEAS